MTENEHAISAADRENPEGAFDLISLLLNDEQPGPPVSTTELPLDTYLAVRDGLKYEGMFFPLGFPVRVLSDSNKVLEAADRSWRSFHALFHCRPLEIAITVKADNTRISVLPPAPTYSITDPLVFQVADRDNFIIADLKHGRAVGRITETTARYESYLRYHILECAALSMLASLRCIGIHGACVRVGNKGVLLCGDSGDGKSTLSFAGARAGWTYISDDATYLPLERNDRLVLGNCHQVRFRPSAAALFPQLAGRPITPRAAGKPSIEVSTSEWPELSLASAAHIDHIVFLNRRCVDAHELIPIRAEAVRPWFQQYLLSTAESAPGQEAALSRLLSADIFELRYQDLAWAIDRIGQLAAKGS